MVGGYRSIRFFDPFRNYASRVPTRVGFRDHSPIRQSGLDHVDRPKDLNDGDPVMKIMALDLGKSKMVGCMYETVAGTHRFESAPLDRGTLETALDAEQPDRVVIEVGTSAGWVGDLVRGRGIELQVANPSHQAWRWRCVKKKTDRLDALKLAELSASDQLPMVHLPQRDVRQWRSLIRYRHRLIARRTGVKNRIRSRGRGALSAERLRGLDPQRNHDPSRARCRR